MAHDWTTLKEQDACDQLFCVLHFVNRTLLHHFVQPFVTPVGAHLRMHHVLVDGGQLVGQKVVQFFNHLFIPFHDYFLLFFSWQSNEVDFK